MSVFFAAVLPVLMLACGFVVDLGMLQFKTMQMQGAADAAAIGAELEFERNTGNWVAQGKLDAGLNGFTDGVNSTTIAIARQPSTGPYANNWDAIQVTISQTVNTIFMGTFHGGKFTVTASAVSLLPPCHYYMNTAGLSSNGLNVASAGDYSACPIYANKAIAVDGFASLYDAATNVAGLAAASYSSGNISPAPRYGALAMADPLASITLPTFPNYCTYTSASYSVSATLNPGVYCNGLKIQGPGAGITVTLNPGLYIVTGGADWQNVTLKGTGVTILFTKGNTAQQGNTYGQLLVRSSTINLSAPVDSTSGGIPRILLCNDRGWVATSAQDFQFLYSNVYGDGIWYFTGTGIYDFGSNSNWSAPNYFAVVADSAYYYYTSLYPSENFSGVALGNPFRPQSVLVQ